MPSHPEHQIAPGVRGWLESPASDVIAVDCLAVAGWAFVRGSKIVDIWSTGFGARRPLQCGLTREDVSRLYPDEPTALHCGFTGYLELDGEPGERVNFDIWARLEDGRSIQLFQRALTTYEPGSGGSLFHAAVRQVLQRPRTLLSSRSWLNAFRLAVGVPLPPPPRILQSSAGKAELRRRTRAALASFLRDGSRLAFTPAPDPTVSVVMIVWNHADLTLTGLRGLADQTDVPMEVVIVDNASTDETPELLTRLSGATIIRNPGNFGFTMAINIGAKAARGEFLLLLNNDAALVPGSVKHMVDAARRSSTIGAVGGKLVYTDGSLQEAGSIIWSDGSCDAYGRGGDPSAPEFNFERPVDFCSAALLLTRRSLFEQLGGLDERYRPAYYDDADYCARVWASGHSVVYQPKGSAIHYEFGSTSPEASMELQLGRRPIFVATHRRWLASQLPCDNASLPAARSHPHGQPSILVIDDAVPDPRIGAGFPRAAVLLKTLAEIGFQITLYVTNEGQETVRTAGMFPGVEVIPGRPTALRAFLTSRRHYHLVIVSRPHNMRYVKAAVGSDLSALGVPCLYDAEAIYSLREIGRRRLIGQPMADADSRRLIDDELNLARGCAAVLAVNETERRVFTAAGIKDVSVVGYAVEPRPTPNPFDRRKTILFIGAFGSDSPNEDAWNFFARDVLPVLRGSGCTAPVVLGGAGIPERLRTLADPTVSVHPDVDDLTPLYDDARVFVAPTRYSAGISLKVIEAAARGVPIVCTTLVADQIGWSSGKELLVAETPTEFASSIALLFADSGLWRRLRDAALERVISDDDPAAFRSALQSALQASAQHNRSRQTLVASSSAVQR